MFCVVWKVVMLALLLLLGRAEKLKIEIGQRKQKDRNKNRHGCGSAHLATENALKKDTIDHCLRAVCRTTCCHNIGLSKKVGGSDQSDCQHKHHHGAQHGDGDQEELLPRIGSVKRG